MSAAAGSASLVSKDTKVEASSVLKRNARLYGAAHMFDFESDNAWNSDQGSPQSLTITLPKTAHLDELRITFQGGFVGQECTLETSRSDTGADWANLHPFEPDDNNTEQVFPVSADDVKRVRIVFNKSTDFYGRVTIYKLDLWGR